MRYYFLILFLIPLFSFSQIEKVLKHGNIYSIPIFPDNNKQQNEIDLDIYLQKGKYIIINEYEAEIKIFKDDVIWHNIIDTIKTKKRGVNSYKVQIPSTLCCPYYRMKIINIEKDIITYLNFEVFNYQLSDKDIELHDEYTIIKDSLKLPNRIKIPVLEDYCYVSLLSHDDTEVFNKLFELPDFPYIDYYNIPIGSYKLVVKTYSKTYEKRIIIKQK